MSLGAFCPLMWESVKKFENQWAEGELRFLLVGWKELQRPEESEYLKES